jgi:hypothetical protein
MTTTLQRRGRRHFLMGLGGFALAMPVMESLLPREAKAAPTAATPRFVALLSGHGGIWPENMYPADATLDQTHPLYAGHSARWGALEPTVESGVAELSPVLRADAGVLTDALASKLMVVRGLDLAFKMGHCASGALGNFADGNALANAGITLETRPTIDQIMAWSNGFYDDLSSIKLRSMQIGSMPRGGMSWNYSNPASRTGPIEGLPTANSSLALFHQIFVPEEDPSVPKRPLVVDRVYESYQRLQSGGFGAAARLSSDDRRKLDDHMARLFELERKLSVTANCGDVPEPEVEAHDYPRFNGDPDDMIPHFQLYNDVIAAAFVCGTSRVASIALGQSSGWVAGFNGNWHQDIAHESDQPAPNPAQGLNVRSNQAIFEHVFLDLAQKLDVDEGDGMTILDNSLLVWMQECGEITHYSHSMPTVTAGRAGGYVNSGRYIDYRNRDNLELQSNESAVWQTQRPGVLYNQWLATVLMAMKVPPSEFEVDGRPGYGLTYQDRIKGNDPEATHPARLFADASNPLPIMVTP